MQAGNSLVRLTLAMALVASSSVLAGESATPSPRIPAFERFGRPRAAVHASAEPSPDPASPFNDLSQQGLTPIQAGRLLLTELNCVTCHQAPGLEAKPAPHLDQLLSRLRPGYLRRFLADPRGVKPGTTMPHAVSALPLEQQGAAVEALTHYLASLSDQREPEQEFPLLGAGERGRRLFHQVGCGACHDAPEPEAPQLSTSAPLDGVRDKYTLPSLAEFLTNPLHVRPGGRMPDLNLSRDDARDIAAYLLQLPETARIRYQYYEGQWDALPDFDTLQPKAVGAAEGIDVQLRQRNDRFGLRFEGLLRISEGGRYRFILGSDDGSRLWLDGELLLDLDGIHAFREATAEKDLQPGSYRVRVDYFEMAGQERVQCRYEGPGVSLRSIAQAMRASADEPRPSPSEAFDVDPLLVDQGRTLFRKIGCAACHVLHENEQRVTPSVDYAPWAKIRADQGCLSDQPNKFSSRFALDDVQRQSLRVALTAGAQHEPDAIEATMLRSNCYACHRRGPRGGVELPRDKFFETTIPEMGDEGRLPPPLDGVGFKLSDKHLTQLLSQGAKDRPYMLARMPRFGEVQLGRLAEQLRQADAQPGLADPHFAESPEEIREYGRVMVGDKGFSCIKCHTFGRFPATGIQALDLQTMGDRLRRDWLRRYLRNPQEFRPRTRMPSAWPVQGKSLLPDLLEGDCAAQVDAVWFYLADGARARIPSGLETPGMELVPVDDAIIYRNFIEGAGPRGIAVGYPESVHLAFDANDLRLALLWQGRFIDAKRHWTGRGEGFQGPAGEHIVTLAPGVAWAVLDTIDQSWPTESARQRGDRFGGYRLTADQRPTFLYEIGGYHIEDWLDTRLGDQAAPLRRTLRVTTPQPNAPTPGILVFRAAAAADIQGVEDGWYVVDRQWRIRASQYRATLRQTPEGYELLYPLTQPTAAPLRLEYSW